MCLKHFYKTHIFLLISIKMILLIFSFFCFFFYMVEKVISRIFNTVLTYIQIRVNNFHESICQLKMPTIYFNTGKEKLPLN